ncbi:MAG: efflux RND transporter permease subunit, partial [Planctomycetota bacterium]
MIRKIIEISLDNRALVLAIFFVVLLLSIQYTTKVSLDALPDLSDPQVIIEIKWDGRTPQTIQDQIVYPLTRYLVSLPKIKIVRAMSFYDFALVFIIFQDGIDIDWARKRVDLEMRSGKFNKPSDAVISIAPDATSVGWVYQYYIEDKSNRYDLGELKSINEYYVKQLLLNISGVAEVATIGGFTRAFQIILDPIKLFQYQIAPQDIKEMIIKNNKDEGMGIQEINEKEYMVAGKGYIKSFQDIENLVIKVTREGTPVRIADVAVAVNLGPLPRRGALDIDGKGEATGGIVIARFGENAYKICKQIQEKITQINRSLPEGLSIKPAYDRSQLIERSVKVLLEELAQIVATLFFVIIVFILHLPSTIIAWLILPVVILFTFALLACFGITSNIMSMGGIAVALGDIADGVISLIENVHKKKEREGGSKQLHLIVKEATLEIGPGIFASLLVLSVSFLPVFALKGQAGRLFYPLAFTKIISLLIASILTITLMPVLIEIFVKGKTIPEHKNPLNRLIINIYMSIMKRCFKYKFISISIAILVFLSMFYPLSKIGTEFLPPLEEGDILYMPTSVPGAAIATGLKTLKQQNKILKTFPEVEVVWGKTGRANTATDPAPIEMFETTVKLKPYKSWPERIVVENSIVDFLKSIAPDITEQNLQIIEKSVKKTFEKELRLRLLTEDYSTALSKSTKILYQLIESILNAQNIPVDEKVKNKVDNFVKNIRLRQVKSIFELMYEEMDRELTFPGFPNIWSMPIRVRLDMLSTGIRSPVGIKVFG